MSGVQPWNHEAEARVLGAVLLGDGRQVVLDTRRLLAPEDFHHPRHAAIWAAMIDLADAGAAIDVVTIEDRIRRRDEVNLVGGIEEIGKLTDRFTTAFGAKEHAQIVYQESIRRGVRDAAGSIFEEVMAAEDPVAYAAQAQLRFAKISESRADDSLKHARESCRESFDGILRDAERHGVYGIPAGLACVDTLLNGLVPKRYYIVAARPSMGKTALATGFAVHNAVWSTEEMLVPLQNRRRLVPALIFSMEMPTPQLLERIAKGMARVDLGEARRRGKLSDTEAKALIRAYEQISQSQLYFDDRRNQSIVDMQTKAWRWRAELARGGYPHADPVLIIVDYVQLGRGKPGGPREKTWEREVSEISAGLQGMAGELNAAVVALSQLNRAVENRDDKRPRLSDLRDSGSLEQDANAVIFPFRAEKYVDADKNPEQARRLEGKAEIIVGKNRDGPVGVGRAEFIGKFTRFQDPPQAEQTNVQF